MSSIELFAARVAFYQTEVEVYAERVKMALLYGDVEMRERCAPRKCLSCGSTDFRHRGFERICSYCRNTH